LSFKRQNSFAANLPERRTFKKDVCLISPVGALDLDESASPIRNLF